MSRFLTRFALSTCVCICFAGVTPAAEQETSARPLPDASRAKILAALDQPTEFDFQERPFGEVMNYLKQKHEIEILLDKRAISDAGVGTDAPITQSLRNVTLRSALRLLLKPFEFTYVVGDGYLQITSKVEAESKLRFKIYPVQDLITLDSDFRPGRPTANSLPPLIEPFPLRPPPKSRDEDFADLIDMITATTAPTTWDEVGGPGSITANPNTQSIGVSQTDDVHEEIVVLLAALRRVRDEQLAAAKPPAAPAETPAKKEPVQLRGYRLMRGAKVLSKSGWRPPVGVAGDSTPPRGAPANEKKAETPPGAPAVPGGAATQAPAKDAPPADQPPPVSATDAKLEGWVEKIAKVIPEIIEPESWQPSGEGMIRAVGEGIVVRNTEEVQHRVVRLMAELLPDYVPVDFNNQPWGPWKLPLQVDHVEVRLKVATTENWPHQAEPRTCGEEARIQEALLEKCILEFDEVPLIDVLGWLANKLKAQLYVDRKALSAAGVGSDTAVTQSAKGLSYQTALKLLLDDLDLTYLIRDEVLLITSKTEAEGMLTTKVYPVFDLVVRPSNASANRPALDFQSLVENVVNSIGPTTWDEVGGPGAIQPFTNSCALVISQTPEIHREIVEYLRAMREIGAAQKQPHADAMP